MRITVIGTGYVGLVTGVCLAEMGNDVVCTVRDNKKRSKLKRGVPTIYEQGLAELLKRNLREDRLRFTGNVASAIRQGEIIFIAVGTPMKKDGSADLSAVHDVADQIGASLKAPAVIAVKSTVPVGTSRIVKQRIARRAKVPFTMASNPEFLSQGRAVRDFLVPNRIIIGVEDPATEATLRELYRPLVRAQQPLLVTTIPSAELMKYASNAFLATKISYMNDLANYAERVGADITEVAKGMGLDDRIGPKFLHAGIGYGGSCFPKDVQALVEDAARHKTPLHILPAVATVNEQQRTRFLHKLRSIYPDLSGKRIAVWGLTFKPKTDDLRDAPSVTIITSLLQAGAHVRAFDPIGIPNARIALAGLPVHFVRTPYDALKGADALLILTEWDEFRSPDFAKVRRRMAAPVILDGRNIYDPTAVRAAGFTYADIGRTSPPKPSALANAQPTPRAGRSRPESRATTPARRTVARVRGQTTRPRRGRRTVRRSTRR